MIDGVSQHKLGAPEIGSCVTLIMTESLWLGLVIGNSRLHWATFSGDNLQATWHTPHLQDSQVEALIKQNFCPSSWPSSGDRVPSHITFTKPPMVWIAAVVPTQAALWQRRDCVIFIKAEHIPLANSYSTLGLDRSLSLLGAMAHYGDPILVIDAGTALTFTAGVEQRFIGGAILPGLRLQFSALAQGTAALPEVVDWPRNLPERWATSTPTAIQSGILYTLLAGIANYIQTWEKQYPNGHVVITGGDREPIADWLAQHDPASIQRLKTDPNLMFWGLQRYRSQLIEG